MKYMGQSMHTHFRQETTSARMCGQVYWWNEKYRPRKPKYFNRVHTGYEWNKYNQTHYDHDNPPPKVVQGYKFNIFYPDLINKEEAPTYSLQKVRSYSSQPLCVVRMIALGTTVLDISSCSRRTDVPQTWSRSLAYSESASQSSYVGLLCYMFLFVCWSPMRL